MEVHFAFVAQLITSIISMQINKANNPEAPSMMGMMLTMPLISLFIGFGLPGGVGFYWIISNILSFIQQVILTNVYSPRKVLAQQMVDETVVRRSKENNTKMRIDIEKK